MTATVGVRPEEWCNPLLWIDLETTGFDCHRNQIIEVAVILTDHNLKEIDSYQSLISSPNGHRTWQDDALRLHKKYGMLERLNGEERQVTVDWAQWYILKMLNDIEEPVLAGNSVHFDRNFIEHYMPELHAKLSYRQLDVSSVTRFMYDCGHRPNINPKEHQALRDIERSIGLYSKWVHRVSPEGSSE